MHACVATPHFDVQYYARPRQNTYILFTQVEPRRPGVGDAELDEARYQVHHEVHSRSDVRDHV